MLIHARIQKYLSGTNVQLGATYNVSKDSTNRYNEGYKAAAKYVNADFDEVGRSIPDRCDHYI